MSAFLSALESSLSFISYIFDQLVSFVYAQPVLTVLVFLAPVVFLIGGLAFVIRKSTDFTPVGLSGSLKVSRFDNKKYSFRKVAEVDGVQYFRPVHGRNKRAITGDHPDIVNSSGKEEF